MTLRVHTIFALVIALAWALVVSTSRLDPNYTAGELLDHLQQWIAGGPLYPALTAEPYRVLNYPPTFLAAARGLSALGIEPLLAGRLVAWIGVVAVVCLFGRWAEYRGRCLTMTHLGLLAASYPALFFVGQMHLQWPTVALSLAGIWQLASVAVSSPLKRGGQGGLPRARVIVAAALLTAACCLKQTQVVSALIGALWLARYHRRLLGWYLGSGLMVGGICAALMIWQFPDLWTHLVTYSVGSYTWPQFRQSIAQNLLPWGIFLAFGWWCGLRRGAGPARADLRWWYFAGHSLALLSVAREGMGAPVFVEWTCATVWWIGPTLAELFGQRAPHGTGHPELHLTCHPERSEGSPDSGEILRRFAPQDDKPSRRWAMALLVQLFLADGYVLARLGYSTWRLEREQRLLPALCAALPSTPSPVVTEDIALVRACGHQPVLHPFIMTSLAKRGLWDETPFVEGLRRGEIPALLLPFDPSMPVHGVHVERWTPAMLAAMAAAYRPQATIGRLTLFTPHATSSFE